MAKFSQTLGGPGYYEQPVNTPNAHPSFMQGLAGAARDLLNLHEQGQQKAAARKKQEAQARTDAAEDFVAQSWFDAQKAAYQPGSVVSGSVDMGTGNTVDPEMPSVPGQVIQGVQELNRLDRAVSQGKVSPEMARMKFEASINTYMREFPDQAAEIAKFMKAQGYDHYLFREVTEAQKWEDMTYDLERQNYQTWVKAAADAGFSGDQATMAAAGRKILANKDEMERSAREVQIIKARQDLDIAAKKAAMEEAQRRGTAAVRSNVHGMMEPVITNLAALINDAVISGDFDVQKELNDLGPLISGYASTVRTQVTQYMDMVGADEETRKGVLTTIDEYEKQIASMVSGPLSVAQTNMRAYQSFQAMTKLDAAQAIPMYTELSDLLGRNALNNVLMTADPGMGMSPKTLQALQAEIKAYTESVREGKLGARNIEGRQSIVNIARILRGDQTLRLGEMDAATAQKTMGGLIATSHADREAILNGTDTSEAAYARYTNATAAMYNAATELQPNVSDPRSARNGLAVIASSHNRELMAKMIADPSQEERGRQLMAGSRMATMQLLYVLDQTQPRKDGWYVDYNADKGVYEAKLKPELYTKKGREGLQRLEGAVLPGNLGLSRALPSYEEALRNPPKDILEIRESMNNGLNHLVLTGKHDDRLPTGMNERQARAFYAKGVVPKKPDGKPMMSIEEERAARYEGFRTMLVSGARQIATDPQLNNVPRGIRNNNPGNIEDGPFARSQPGYVGSDGRFARFESAEHGEQASANLLKSYGKRGFDTPMEIINRWAPPSDNNPTEAYAQFVAKQLGVGLNDRLDLDDPSVRLKVYRAIKKFENGER